MNRVTVAAATTVVVAFSLTGCSTSDPPAAAPAPTPVQDSDRDGVPDSDDYSPYDPEIQTIDGHRERQEAEREAERQAQIEEDERAEREAERQAQDAEPAGSPPGRGLDVVLWEARNDGLWADDFAYFTDDQIESAYFTVCDPANNWFTDGMAALGLDWVDDQYQPGTLIPREDWEAGMSVVAMLVNMCGDDTRPD